MNRENKKLARRRRAAERKRQQKRKQTRKVLVSVTVAAIVLVLIVVIVSAAKKSRAADAEKAARESAAEAIETESKAEAEPVKVADLAAFDPEKMPDAYDISKDDLTYAQISIKDYGTITMALDSTVAPVSVKNFASLARNGFYDGLTFHRIIDGFMIQGGDPLGNGTGGSDQNIKGEFSGNGVDNPITHVRGAVSMARSQDPDSASSQFFIVQSDSSYLDGQYAGFGYVTDGMDIVDKICKDAKPSDSNGTIPADQQPVIESVRIVEPDL